jgi:hypothetical protein
MQRLLACRHDPGSPRAETQSPEKEGWQAIATCWSWAEIINQTPQILDWSVALINLIICFFIDVKMTQAR